MGSGGGVGSSGKDLDPAPGRASTLSGEARHDGGAVRYKYKKGCDDVSWNRHQELEWFRGESHCGLGLGEAVIKEARLYGDFKDRCHIPSQSGREDAGSWSKEKKMGMDMFGDPRRY